MYSSGHLNIPAVAKWHKTQASRLRWMPKCSCKLVRAQIVTVFGFKKQSVLGFSIYMSYNFIKSRSFVKLFKIYDVSHRKWYLRMSVSIYYVLPVVY